MPKSVGGPRPWGAKGLSLSINTQASRAQPLALRASAREEAHNIFVGGFGFRY